MHHRGLRALFWWGHPLVGSHRPLPCIMLRGQLGGFGCVRRDHDCHRSNSDCAAVATGQTSIVPRLASVGGDCKRSHRALAAVLAYEVIVVSVAASTVGEAAVQLIIGLIVSSAAGVAGAMALPSVQTRMGS